MHALSARDQEFLECAQPAGRLHDLERQAAVLGRAGNDDEIELTWREDIAGKIRGGIRSRGLAAQGLVLEPLAGRMDDLPFVDAVELGMVPRQGLRVLGDDGRVIERIDGNLVDHDKSPREFTCSWSDARPWPRRRG